MRSLTQLAFDNDDKKSQKVAKAWSKGDASRACELLRQLWCPTLKGQSLGLFRKMVEQNATEVFENRSQGLVEPAPQAGRLGTIRVPTTVLVGDRDNPASAVFARRKTRRESVTRGSGVNERTASMRRIPEFPEPSLQHGRSVARELPECGRPRSEVISQADSPSRRRSVRRQSLQEP